jgi:hypothetical protein
MHRASLTVKVGIAIPLILLAAAVTVIISSTVSEDVFAREDVSAQDGGRYLTDSTTSQAAAVSNDCLSPILDSNTVDNVVGVGNCDGTVTQQDESGQASAPTTSQTANPTIELQRATTTQPGLGAPTRCEDCFDPLSPSQLNAFVGVIPGLGLDLDGVPVRTIEQLCEFIRENGLDNTLLLSLFEALTTPPVNAGSLATGILECLSMSVP